MENCDNIKQVMEQNKTLKNAKIVSVSFRFFIDFERINNENFSVQNVEKTFLQVN